MWLSLTSFNAGIVLKAPVPIEVSCGKSIDESLVFLNASCPMTSRLGMSS